MSRVVIFNGPPRSGKDTAVNTIWQLLDRSCIHIKMADPITNSVKSLFGIQFADWQHIYNNFKDAPHPQLQGMTPREACIWLSEEVVKPKFGKDFFGRIAARRCTDAIDGGYTVLMSDGGFLDEVQCIVDHVGSEHVVLVHLHRPGFDFANDSRSLLDHQQLGIPRSNFTSVINCGDLQDYQQQLKLRVLPLLTDDE